MNAFRSESLKLTSLRLPWAMLGLAVLLGSAVGAVNVHALADHTLVTFPQLAVAVAEPAWFLVIVVAVLAAAAEFQHNTVVTTLLTTPRRVQVLGAKAGAAAAYGVALTAVAVAVAWTAGAITATVDDLPLHGAAPAAWAGAVGAVAVGGLWGVLASALGLLTRSTAIGLTVVLLWKFVLEGVLPVVLRNPAISDWTPSGAVAAVVNPAVTDPSPLVGGLVMVGYAAALCALAAGGFLARDPR